MVEAAEVGRAKAELLLSLAEDDLRRKIVGRLTPGSSDGVVACDSVSCATGGASTGDDTVMLLVTGDDDFAPVSVTTSVTVYVPAAA